ncbi:hypothetical protein LTR09_004325 [Extremus antarcticus]|uniref:Fe2OG dioxygenase domain-containing protein n=1 Tax=Extremus antarcticus TaxID=702011 RepID=A0AAJ0DI84_9PEZI|nr:hypothetical protein LTR09_004325 [Extremus antarcticus]
MASPFAALLSQSTPVQTRKALILTGLQNDFLSSEGKLPVSTPTGFLDRLHDLVKDFREHGDVIWVRSHFAENRAVNQDDDAGDTVVIGSGVQRVAQAERQPTPAQVKTTATDEEHDDKPPSPAKKARLSFDVPGSNALAPDSDAGSTSLGSSDEELFLTRTDSREPCCIPGSFGADYPNQIKDLVDQRRDLQLVKTYYSAFASTSLLMTLRVKFVTELYICGCTTNLSLFATAMGAARHGISITLIEDCLGYRKRDRHDEAIKQLRETMGARVITSKKVIEELKNPAMVSDEEEDNDSEVAVGEDADTTSVDPLAVDSNNEEEDEVLAASVRIPYLNGRAFAIHKSLASSLSSHPAAASETQPRASIKPREPASARAADSSSGPAIGQRDPVDTTQPHAGDGNAENHFEGWIGRATARRTSMIEKDESSDGVTTKVPWATIDKAWAAHTETLRKQSAQSSHSGLAAMSAIVGLDQNTVNQYEEMMAQAKSDNAGEASHVENSKPLFGDDTEVESAGSRILYGLLPNDLEETIFDTLNGEITWQKMHHQTGEVPRLVCCQGTIGEDGGMPVYRHPSDQTLPIESWTFAVDQVRKAAEQVVGHPLNHALIQLYRGGTDYISEHSDKTLDITKGSSIVNVSFGAQRTMRIRSKRAATSLPSPLSSLARTTHRIPMPHNSMITMTLPTNAEYLHGITADKRPRFELTDDETAFGGQRISLTFRRIATFLAADSNSIWGQGATAKLREDAKAVINAEPKESEKLVRAFGKENAATSIDWESIYGDGFDVLHLK